MRPAKHHHYLGSMRLTVIRKIVIITMIVRLEETHHLYQVFA